MGDVWYDRVALRNNGYKSNAVFEKIGVSGEDVFENQLLALIYNKNVLDAGCGDGDFTFRMAPFVNKMFGFDYSQELVKLAKKKLESIAINNIDIVFSSTKNELPFKDEFFDVIFSRRGPTSIIEHKRLLKKDGIIIGIHSAAKDVVLERLVRNGFKDIEINEYGDCVIRFTSEIEYIRWLSAFPGNPDYENGENKEDLERIINENSKNGIIEIKEWRYIWTARKD